MYYLLVLFPEDVHLFITLLEFRNTRHRDLDADSGGDRTLS